MRHVIGEGRPARVLVLAAALAAAGVAAAAGDDPATVDDVLRGVLAARGGAERWQQVTAMRIEGTWSMLGEDSPMTILRRAPDRYRMDFTVLGAPATLAFDGETVWVHGAAFEAASAQELTEPWKRNVLEDAPFGSLLLWYAAHGAEIELAGRAEVEGTPCHELVVRAEGAPVERWFVEVATLLEYKRVSMTYDVFSGPGAQAEMETFFMDYREVDGLMLHHREERHFSTRYNVLEAATIEVDPELEEAAFRMPPPVEPGSGTAGRDEG